MLESMNKYSLEARVGALERRLHDLEVYVEHQLGDITASLKCSSESMTSGFKRQTTYQKQLERQMFEGRIEGSCNEIDERLKHLSEDVAVSFRQQLESQIQFEGQMEERFSEVDECFVKAEERFYKMDKKVGECFEKIETDLGQMKTMFAQILERLPGQ